MVSRKWDFLFWSIFVLYCAGFIGLNFSVYPPGNGRDELDHLKLIEFYTEEKRFPKLPGDWVSPQAHQPPLYYVLMAGFSKIALLPTESTRYELNPFFLAENYNPALPYYNRVLYVQPPHNVPYVFSFRVLRGVSLFLHGFGLVFVWKAIRELFRDKVGRIVAPLALSFLALTPSFWRVALAVSNNALLFPLGAMAFWLLARGLRRGWTIRSATLLGVVLGLGLLTKLYMLPLVVTTVIIMGKSRVKANAINRVSTKVIPGKFPAIFIVLGICVLISGGWYLRNFVLYGDFGAISVSEEEQGSRRETPPTIHETVEIVAYWPGQLWVESWIVLNTRSILKIASGIGWGVLLNGLVGLRRIQRMMIPGGAGLLLAGFFPALGFAVVGALRNQHAAYTPPLMIVGLPALSVLFACGVLAWVPHKSTNPAKRMAFTGICLILVGSVAYTGAIFAPQFPAFDSLEDGQTIPNPVWVRFENGARLLGYKLEDTVLHPGDLTRVQLCWETVTPIKKDYAFSVQFVLLGHPKAALQDGYPLSGRYPTRAWRVPFCEWVPLRVSEDAVTPRAYPLRVNMYEVGGYDVPYIRESSQRSTVLLLDRVTIIEEPPKNLPSIKAKIDEWGGLTNYEGSFREDSFSLRLDWVALGSSLTPYHYFLHARDREGNILAQLDRPPLYNNFPTDTWVQGAQFSEVLHLELPPGTVEVFFGMYDPVRLQRGNWMIEGEIVGDGLLFPSP